MSLPTLRELDDNLTSYVLDRERRNVLYQIRTDKKIAELEHQTKFLHLLWDRVRALEAKMEALAPLIEAPAPEREDEEEPEVALGAFGQLSVEEQHRLQQRGGDY
jgi:hypothetical protein